ncbi:hypothetical protein PG984_006480 [Apiospora sp. TS-2023a]
MGLPTLRELLYMGFHSGMRWDTKREESKKHNAYVYQSLLSSKYTKPLVKGLVQASRRGDDGIANLSKDTVSDAFAALWNTAADNVKHCREMRPMQFWSGVKAAYGWASTIPDDAFFEFTLRAIHARNIFKEYQRKWQESTGTSMSKAIDRFLDAFTAEYNVMYGEDEYEKMPPGKADPTRIPEIMSVRAKAMLVHNEYLPLPLTSAKFQGSGDNKEFIDKEFTAFMQARRAAEESQANAEGRSVQPPGNVDTYYMEWLYREEASGDKEKKHPWREGADSDSGNEAHDYEDWEEDFVEGQEDAGGEGGRDAEMGEHDTEMGDLAASLLEMKEQDQMELDE